MTDDQATSASFLREAPTSDETVALFDRDVADRGYVMNLSRLWAHQPEADAAIRSMMGLAASTGALDLRQRAVLISALASSLGDSYCSIAWGTKLAGETADDVAAAVLRGDDDGLGEVDRALATWARRVARDPNGTDASDVQSLRDVGFTDTQIFGITLFVAMRLAFSSVNDALGCRPDAQLAADAPAALRDAVTFGRTPG